MNADDDGDIDEQLERFLLLDQNDFGFLFIDQSTNLKPYLWIKILRGDRKSTAEAWNSNVDLNL